MHLFFFILSLFLFVTAISLGLLDSGLEPDDKVNPPEQQLDLDNSDSKKKNDFSSDFSTKEVSTNPLKEETDSETAPQDFVELNEEKFERPPQQNESNDNAGDVDIKTIQSEIKDDINESVKQLENAVYSQDQLKHDGQNNVAPVTSEDSKNSNQATSSELDVNLNVNEEKLDHEQTDEKLQSLEKADNENLTDEISIKNGTVENSETANSSYSHVNEIDGASLPTPDENVPSFEVWKEKQLATDHAEKEVSQVLSQSNKGPNGSVKDGVNGISQSTHGARTSRVNYASAACGAKVVGVNPEAQSPFALLTENKDQYMIQPCKAKKWLVIELCETLQLRRVELANLELFSSLPEKFNLYISERYPSKDWKQLGTFQAREERLIQSFAVNPLDVYAKFIKIEMLTHYGTEHYCPLTVIRVFGVVDSDEDSDYNSVESEYPQTEPEHENEKSKNLFNSATDTVINLVKSVLTPSVTQNEDQKTSEDLEQNKSTTETDSKLIKEDNDSVMDSANGSKNLNFSNNSQDSGFMNNTERLNTFPETPSVQTVNMENQESKPSEKKGNDVKSTVSDLNDDDKSNQALVTLIETPVSLHDFSQCFPNKKMLTNQSNTFFCRYYQLIRLFYICPYDSSPFSIENIEKTIHTNTSITDFQNLNSTKSVNAKENLSSSTDIGDKIHINGPHLLKPDIQVPSNLQFSSELEITVNNSSRNKTHTKQDDAESNQNKTSSDNSTKANITTSVENNNTSDSTPVTPSEPLFDPQLEILEPPVLDETMKVPNRKDSLIVKLKNKVKLLEKNLNLSSRYLEEVRQFYNRQMEDLSFNLNFTISRLNNLSSQEEIRNHNQSRTIMRLQEQMYNMSLVIIQKDEAFPLKVSTMLIILILLQSLSFALIYILFLKVRYYKTVYNHLCSNTQPKEAKDLSEETSNVVFQSSASTSLHKRSASTDCTPHKKSVETIVPQNLKQTDSLKDLRKENGAVSRNEQMKGENIKKKRKKKVLMKSFSRDEIHKLSDNFHHASGNNKEDKSLLPISDNRQKQVVTSKSLDTVTLQTEQNELIHKQSVVNSDYGEPIKSSKHSVAHFDPSSREHSTTSEINSDVLNSQERQLHKFQDFCSEKSGFSLIYRNLNSCNSNFQDKVKNNHLINQQNFVS